MGGVASIGFVVAERVERAGGARAGLSAYKTLAENTADAEVRGRALLAGLRCAVALRDHGALNELTALWSTVALGMWSDELGVLFKALGRERLHFAATELAHAECRRHPTARALYTYARCLDLAKDRRAPDAFANAIVRALNEGATAIARASRVRRAACLARAYETLPEALAEVAEVDLAGATAEERLVVARVSLSSPSRFVRAGAVTILESLIAEGDPAMATRALETVARWADATASTMTPLEIERLLVLFGRDSVVKVAPQARATMAAIARVAQARTDNDLAEALRESERLQPSLAAFHARAHALLQGRLRPSGSAVLARPRSAEVLWNAILDVATALRDEQYADVVAALRALCEAEERGETCPPQTLELARHALARDNAELRSVAARFIAARVRQTSAGGPPRGWLGLADILVAVDMSELADRVRDAAAAAKEPGAVDALAFGLTKKGWELARTGDRTTAIDVLRRAKALSLGRSATATATAGKASSSAGASASSPRA